jgi:hypothetical protein
MSIAIFAFTFARGKNDATASDDCLDDAMAGASRGMA